MIDVAEREPRKMTFDSSPQLAHPAWSPDGRELVYAVAKGPLNYVLHALRVGGGGIRELGPGLGPVALERDEARMIVTLFNENGVGELWRVGLDRSDANERVVGLLDDVRGWASKPALSPNGGHLAYQKGLGDAATIFVRTYPALDGPQQIGTGSAPRWSPKGDRLFYLAGSTMMAVSVTTGSTFRAGTPQELFDVELAPAGVFEPGFDVGPGGDTFVWVRPIEPIPGIVVLQNWLGAVR